MTSAGCGSTVKLQGKTLKDRGLAGPFSGAPESELSKLIAVQEVGRQDQEQKFL